MDIGRRGYGTESSNEPTRQTSVAVVVPTRNSARTLNACLLSLTAQSEPCQIVVVDNFSSDNTLKIAEQSADYVLTAGPERSAQRNIGAAVLDVDIIGFIDSDMIVSSSVVAQAVAAIQSGAGAVVVPERTIGTGFWAKVRAFERSFYLGLEDVEAARFFRANVFNAVGGFDEALNAGEDWDLTIRVRAVAPVERCEAFIDHDEGHVTYLADCRKKSQYATGIRDFTRKHGAAALLKAGNRPYLREPTLLVWPHPILGLGLFLLKLGEVVAGLFALGKQSVTKPVARVSSRK